MTSLVQCKASVFTSEGSPQTSARPTESEGLFRNRRPKPHARHDAYMTNLPPGMYPTQQPLYAQQLLPGWEDRTQGKNGGGGNGGGDGGDGPFAEAFDFSFEKYATPAVVKVVYMLTVIFSVLTYVGNVFLAFAIFLPDQDIAGFKYTGSAFPGIVMLLLGWIPAFIIILVIRVALEQALATVRTAIDARALRMRYVGGVAV